MKKSTIIILAVVAVVVLYVVVAYNGLVSKQESVSEAWANVETVYQRRADLIPNLVNTVKGYASHEQETFLRTVEARAKNATIDPSTATDAELAEWQRAQDDVLNAINLVVEAYPELKASQNFLALQEQLEGTENRISVERNRYNEAVKKYNVKIRRFPTNLLAGAFGFEKMAMFEAQPGAEIAPEVVF